MIDEKYLKIHATEYYQEEDFWGQHVAAWVISAENYLAQYSERHRYLEYIKQIRYLPLSILEYLAGFMETYPTSKDKRCLYLESAPTANLHLPQPNQDNGWSDKDACKIILLDNKLLCEACGKAWPCNQYLNAIQHIHILRKLKDLEW